MNIDERIRKIRATDPSLDVMIALDALEELLDFLRRVGNDPVSVAFGMRRRCRTCYGKDANNCTKHGDFCHRCGGTEELT
jgi:rRNA maturation endonuclease Nob1